MLEPDVKAHQGAAVVLAVAAFVQLRIAGDGQALEAAPREAESEQAEGVEQSVDRVGGSRFQYDAEQAARAAPVALPQVVVARAGQGWEKHLRDLVLRLQPGGDLQRAGALALEP